MVHIRLSRHRGKGFPLYSGPNVPVALPVTRLAVPLESALSTGFCISWFAMAALMLTEIAFALKGGNDPPPFFFIFCLIVAFILFDLWNRRYRRKWHQFRAQDWPKVEGIFVSGEGEVVTMRRGSSNKIAGYEAQLYYEYQCDGERGGIYTRSFSTSPEAETFLKLLEGKKIPVRVKQQKPSRSYILDRDVELITGPLSGSSVVE